VLTSSRKQHGLLLAYSLGHAPHRVLLPLL
jgi:hypothetical protein